MPLNSRSTNDVIAQMTTSIDFNIAFADKSMIQSNG